MSGLVKQITSAGQFNTIVASGKLIYIDLYADWCGPCKQISPVFEQLAKDNVDKEDAEFYKINIDDLPEVADALGVRSIPTFHAYKDGKRIDQIVGASRAALTILVNACLTRW